jgi:hypothetical protein
MNLRCAFCQTPYAIGRNETIAALQMMEAENLSHYDAHCPRCRRATQIPRQKLELSMPSWKEALAAATQPEPAPAKPEAKPAAKVADKKPAAAKAAPVKKSVKK